MQGRLVEEWLLYGRRVGGASSFACEPITNHSIKFLEAELGEEYTPSLTRLKRR